MNLEQALRLRATYVPPQQKGNYKIERVTVPKGTRLRLFPFERFPNPLPKARRSTQLNAGEGWKKKILMSDTEMELRTNWQGVRHCHGHVLVGGLGLGLCLKMLDAMDEVKSITCIELSQDICDLVAPHLNLKKLRLVKQCPHGIFVHDIFDFLKATTMRFDTAYADLNSDYNFDHYAQYVWHFREACRGVVKNARLNARHWIEDYLKWAAVQEYGSLKKAVQEFQKPYPATAALGGKA